MRDVSFFKQNHIMALAINVKSYPVLFLVIGTFGILLIFLYHSNREVLHQTYQDNFVNGKSTLEQAQGKQNKYIQSSKCKKPLKNSNFEQCGN